MVGLQSILTLYGSGGINVNQSTTAVSIVAKITNAAPQKIREIRVIRDNPRFRTFTPVQRPKHHNPVRHKQIGF